MVSTNPDQKYDDDIRNALPLPSASGKNSSLSREVALSVGFDANSEMRKAALILNAAKRVAERLGLQGALDGLPFTPEISKRVHDLFEVGKQEFPKQWHPRAKYG